MRVKQLTSFPPLPSLRLVWDRITFSRLTIAYFAFSFLHFVLQLSFQIKAFTINADAAQFLKNIVLQAHATNDSLAYLHGSTLSMCSWLSSDLDIDNADCQVIWNGTKGSNSMEAQADKIDTVSVLTSTYVTASTSTATSLSTTASTVTTSLASSQSPTIVPVLSIAVPPTITIPPGTSTSIPTRVQQTVTVFVEARPTTTRTSTDLGRLGFEFDSLNDDDHGDDRDDDDHEALSKRSAPQVLAFIDGDHTKVNVSGIGSDDSSETLDGRCLWALNWPVGMLHNTKREDLVFIAFQFWVLGMSIVALLNESIPHILASLLTHVLATSWTAYQLTATEKFRSDFNRVITNGACNGVSLLPRYWNDRGGAEIPSLALNVFALLVSSFLTWRLIKLFGWQTFKRVGASLTINRVYKIVLVLSIVIQLCLFFMIITVSLWLDQLFNSAIGDLATFRTLYEVSSIITLVLLVPWLMTGWFAVRRELRVPMFIFLMLSCLYLGGWSVMFFSTTFRWTFVTWRFFSVIACASVFLTLIAFILGIVCRLNFGKGLVRYLNAHQSLPGDDYVPYDDSDIEKVDFPSNEKLVPTFAATLGPEPDLPPPGIYVTRGPRFFNQSAQPFETVTPGPIAIPPATLGRSPSGGSSSSRTVSRSDSRTSDKSFGSLGSYYSYNGYHGRSDSQTKRWVIE